eukprot:11534969-Ditylum_brightwellii.AAC.1
MEQSTICLPSTYSILKYCFQSAHVDKRTDISPVFVCVKIWIAWCNHLYRQKDINKPSHLGYHIRDVYCTLLHSTFHEDQLLFDKPLCNRLHSTSEAKKHWLNAVEIAVNDFTAAHDLKPTQQPITQFFLAVSYNPPLETI